MSIIRGYLFFINFIFCAGVIGAQSNVIINGDFETGDFSGWSAMNTGNSLGWNINDGTYTGSCASLGPFANRLPMYGNYDVISDQRSAGMNMISTGFIIPDPLVSARLSWTMMYDNSFSTGNPPFQDPNQEFRMVIVDSFMNPVDTVWSTEPGDPVQILSTTHMSVEISDVLAGMEGQMAYLLVEEEDNLGCFNVVLDNISLSFSQAAIPTMGAWGRILLILLFMIVAVGSIKQSFILN